MRRRGGGEGWQNQENGKGCGRGWPCKRFSIDSIRPTLDIGFQDVCRTFIRDAVPGDETRDTYGGRQQLMQLRKLID